MRNAWIGDPTHISRGLIASIAIALLISFCSLFLAPMKAVNDTAIRVLPSVVWIVPSVSEISSEMRDPISSEIVLLLQWPFALIYLILWFGGAPPWTSRMRQEINKLATRLSKPKRIIMPLIGISVFSAWVLGDLGVIQFPTLFNGGFVYPRSHAIVQFQAIYTSRFTLALYAWFCPLGEVTVIWFLSLLLFNFKTYITPKMD